ncbi:MAG: tRNA 2-selenouridine(34) synthase MnmH [Nanoarchaeota archaeon]
MKAISIKNALNLGNKIFVDVRCEKEFNEDKIIGAINLPILNTDERKEVGTLYKICKEKAFFLGINYYSKKLPLLTQKIKKIDKKKNIIVYCFRGGTRSKTITHLFEFLGFNVYQLEGGYKAYRHFIIDYFANFNVNFNFIVLYGLTGCGKTKIINLLKNSIDIENVANHRSSLFGGIGLKPNSQKMFESLLFYNLNKLNDNSYIFIEGESRKIGNVVVPEKLYSHIKSGINILIKANLEFRKKITVEEYFKEEYISEIKKVVLLLKQKLGKKKIDEILNNIEKNNYLKSAEILLTKYYDPLYEYTINNQKYDYIIEKNNIDEFVFKLDEIYESLKKIK